jgi:hypothetical protein
MVCALVGAAGTVCLPGVSHSESFGIWGGSDSENFVPGSNPWRASMPDGTLADACQAPVSAHAAAGSDPSCPTGVFESHPDGGCSRSDPDGAYGETADSCTDAARKRYRQRWDFQF